MRPSYARLSLVVEPRHTNSFGSVHGGVIATLMDTVMGIALRASHEPGDRDLVGQSTIEMNVSFLKGAPQGDRLVVEARLLHKGRNLAVGDVEVRQQSGDLVAKGRLTYFILRRAR
jgi:acyl-CoA thioesterase